jgi:hypothetical protein
MESWKRGRIGFRGLGIRGRTLRGKKVLAYGQLQFLL